MKDGIKELKRIPSKGTFTGIIAGFSEYFQIDVTLLRVLFVVFVLVTGFFPGVFAYFIALLIMPIDAPVVHQHQDASSSSV